MPEEIKNYESLYVGGYSSLNPDYGNFVGYRLESAQIGAPTSIQTANQLNEVVSRIKEGVKNVELQPLQPDIFEQIPKQHFKEIQALMKLSGVRPSVHAPIIDPAGFGERVWEGEMAREAAERRLFATIEKSHELDPQGNIPIVFHSSGGIPGAQFRPKKGVAPGEPGRFEEQKAVAINQETKQMVPVEVEEKYYPGRAGKVKVTTTEEEIDTINNSEWINSVTNLAFYKKESNDLIQNAHSALAPWITAIEKGQLTEKDLTALPAQEKMQIQGAVENLGRAELFLQNVEASFNTLYNKAYKYGDDKTKKVLIEISKDWKQQAEESEKLRREAERDPLKGAQLIFDKSALLDKTLQVIKDIPAPKVFVPVEDFAMDKAAQTFGNMAFKSFDKFGDSAPIIAIENMYQGFAFSRAEDMEKLVKKSKQAFVKKAVEEGMSKSAAKRQADKLLGITWDVGHVNVMRKHGFTEEDVIKETEKIAKLVKHVHLTDNFGYADTHLPPGMGNVPTKEILKKLEKAGALKDARAIVEAGSFVQHFKKSPHPWVLGAFGSGIYGAKMEPYWNQITGVQGHYFSFPLAYLPEKHFSTYGSGFSSLPEELGGQIPGAQSRLSGAPMA